jgi:hypothetical protein
MASIPPLSERGDTSGWPELDAVLPWGDWPHGALTELYVARYGIGEIRLLLPALVRIAREGDPQVWIAPPMLPYAPALAAAGLVLDRLLIVQPRGPVDTAWSIETCLRTEGCGAVLAWPPVLSMLQLRRLQLAAASSGARAFLFRCAGARRQPSPAALRIGVTPLTDGLELELFKVRGGRTDKVRIEWNR